MKTGFDWGMHYFRGFAICAIVLHHIIQLMGHDHFADSFTQGGTIYFLFISGYLSQYLAEKKPTLAREFFRKKLVNVIAPFIVFSILTLLAVNCLHLVRPTVIEPGLSALTLLKVFFFGRAQGPYWYIPFVTILFAATPSLVRLSSKRLGALTFFALLAAAIFPKRTILFYLVYPDFANLYIYFTWTYLAGMLYARYKQSVDEFLKPTVGLFLGFGVVIGLSLYYPGFLGFELCHPGFALALQKVCFGAVALVVFNRLGDRRIAALDYLAKYSFTLFFAHVILIPEIVAVRDACVGAWSLSHFTTIMLEATLALVFLVVLTSASAALKALFGRYSRSLIGS